MKLLDYVLYAVLLALAMHEYKSVYKSFVETNPFTCITRAIDRTFAR